MYGKKDKYKIDEKNETDAVVNRLKNDKKTQVFEVNLFNIPNDPSNMPREHLSPKSFFTAILPR